MAFVKEENYTPNWMALFVSVLNRNPANAAGFARMLIKNPGGPLIEINAAVDALMERNMVKDTTSLLLDVLENKVEHGALQTRLFEINLKAVSISFTPQIQCTYCLGSSHRKCPL